DRLTLFGDLKRFAGQLLTQEEELRRTLARDLHDELAPILVSAHGQLQSAGVENEQIAQAVALLRRAIRATRDILGAVRPATLDDLGLLVMRERIAFLGGVIKVQSRPGAGTTVRVVVPRERMRP